MLTDFKDKCSVKRLACPKPVLTDNSETINQIVNLKRVNTTSWYLNEDMPNADPILLPKMNLLRSLAQPIVAII
jgi:hypothetical protein